MLCFNAAATTTTVVVAVVINNDNNINNNKISHQSQITHEQTHMSDSFVRP